MVSDTALSAIERWLLRERERSLISIVSRMSQSIIHGWKKEEGGEPGECHASDGLLLMSSRRHDGLAVESENAQSRERLKGARELRATGLRCLCVEQWHMSMSWARSTPRGAALQTRVAASGAQGAVAVRSRAHAASREPRAASREPRAASREPHWSPGPGPLPPPHPQTIHHTTTV
jgi:hypothetical protein